METYKTWQTAARCGGHIEVGVEHPALYQCELYAGHKSVHWYTEHHPHYAGMAIVWRDAGSLANLAPITPNVEQ